MNDQQLIKKVNEVAENQRQQRGYIAPVDVLMEIGVLTKQNYEAWRFGKVSYLEKACTCNLNKLTKILKQIYKYVQKCSETIHESISAMGEEKRESTAI